MGDYDECHLEFGQQRLFNRCWRPAEHVRGAVVIVHGLCEHGGRYADLAAELQGHGYSVDAPDLRGHGRSSGSRIAIRRFDDYLDDVEQLLARVRGQHPGRPVFLLGHSMGGAIVLCLAIRRRVSLDGLVVSAPPVRVVNTLFPVLRHLAGVCSAVAPWLRLVRMGSALLSRDPAVVADFRADPLVFHDKFPARTGAEILSASRTIQRAAASITVPLLILHGTDDYVTDPQGSRMLFDRAATVDKTLHLYPGLYHDLFHEPERGQVTADLLAWLDKHNAGR